MYKRIMHLVHTLRHSGAESLVRDLCLLHQDGGTASAIASFWPPQSDYMATLEYLERNGVKVYIPDTKLTGLQRSRHYAAAYRDFKPEIIYGHGVIPALYGRLALPLSGNRSSFVPVLHSATNDDYNEWKLVLSEFVLAFQAKSVIAVSPEGAHAYCRRFPHHRPVRVVPNGVDLQKVSRERAKRDTWRSHFGLAPDDKIILQVGSLFEVKQQLLTLESVAPILDRKSNVQLWFVGTTQLLEDGSYEAKLRERIQSMGLSSRVRLLGGRCDIPELLSAADLYVMPSQRESQGIAMIEALASGVPIVASDIAAFRYTTALGGVALFPLSDKVEFTASMARMLAIGGRFDRDVSRLDIRTVAAIYGGYEGEANRLGIGSAQLGS